MPVQPAMREPGIARDVGHAHTGQPPLAVQAGCCVQDALPVLCDLCFGNLHGSLLLIAVVRKMGLRFMMTIAIIKVQNRCTQLSDEVNPCKKQVVCVATREWPDAPRGGHGHGPGVAVGL